MFPGSTDSGTFWRNILAGTDNVGDVPPGRWRIEDHYDPDPSAPDKTYCKRGAFLDPVDFPALEYGVPPNAVPATDTSQLLALLVARQVLDDAADGQFHSVDRDRISVILGATSGQSLFLEAGSRLQRPVWVRALREAGVAEDKVVEICDRIADSYTPWQENTFPGLLGNVVAGRIANRFDFGGTNCVTDAACASALSALSMALGELREGRSDVVITGGVDTFNDLPMYVCFSKTPAMSRTGDCRPFSADADGTILGEGLGMLALRRLDDAERDGDRIYAVIRGIGTASDGRAKSIYAPRPAGQAKAIGRAYEEAGYDPVTVELIEAHGTATKAGDLCEVSALKEVFARNAGSRRNWCALGSIKAQIGHTKAAAGAAGLIKVILALHNKAIPPAVKIDRPNPDLELDDSPIYLTTEARPWIRAADHPRRAAVSSFGFGGSNFHATVEEYTGPGAVPAGNAARSSELILVSAETPEALDQAIGALDQGEPLSHLAYRCALSFSGTHAYRLAVVAGERDEFAKKLNAARARIAKSPDEAFAGADGTSFGCGGPAGKLAFLFPGQGSQYTGMGRGVALAFPAARTVWDRIAGFDLFGGTALHHVAFPPTAFDEETKKAQSDRLRATEWAQPAIGAVSASLLAVLDALGIEADCAAGHSFGEVTALFAAGALDEGDFLALARRRGELMAAAAETPGAMLAVPLSAEEAAAHLSSSGSDLVIANCNAPRQTVLSGTVEAIGKAAREFDDKGVSAVRLPVATAFHSPLVAPAAQGFAEALSEVRIRGNRIPVYGNVEAAAYPKVAAKVRQRLARQIVEPVRFADMIAAMYADGARVFLEVGPGSVLGALVGQCLDGKAHVAVSLDRKGGDAVTALWGSLGRLAAAGVAFDPEGLARLIGSPATAKETSEKPGFSISIDGGNYGRPYPDAAGRSTMPPPNPTAQPVPSPAAADRSSPEIGQAYTVYQQALQESHLAYQKVLAESHQGFLKAMEDGFRDFCAAAGDADAPAARRPVVSPPLPPATPEPPRPVQRQEVPVSPPPPPVPATNLGAVLIQVVAEKTGYPEDMIEPDMSLEADLGIDSIKRVEIFSALQERCPDLPSVEASDLGALDTLSAILAFLGAESVEDVTSIAPAGAGVALAPLLVSIVAEKTGYPEDMIEPGMSLEADLGIDSIKRVEIFSALQERCPDLPAVEASDLGALESLADIIAFLDGGNAKPPSNGIGRRRVRAVETPADGIDMLAGGGAMRLAIVPDDGGVAEELARGLAKRGHHCEIVEEVTGGNGAACDGVIFLAGLARVATVEEARMVNRRAFAAARAVAGLFGERGGVFVTVQDTGGDFGLEGCDGARAWLGGLPGLVKTAAIEWPQCRLKAIDLEQAGRPAETLAGRIARELVDGGPELEVGLRDDGTRISLDTVAAPLDGRAVSGLEDGAVIVASGGARGVTAAALIGLGKLIRPRILLLGRTPRAPLPEGIAGDMSEAEVRQTIIAAMAGEGATPAVIERQVKSIHALLEVEGTLARLEAAGAEVRYAAVDIRDVQALAAELAAVRADWGPVQGLVHGAGVIADKALAGKTLEQFDTVFSTKVSGLAAMLEATRDDPLKFIQVFSSVAGRYGNRGQSDYAMANEVLNKVANAEARSRNGRCLVRAINWGPWDGGMVTPALRDHLLKAGVPLISMDDGVSAFLDEFRQDGDGPAEVILGAALSTRS